MFYKFVGSKGLYPVEWALALWVAWASRDCVGVSVTKLVLLSYTTRGRSHLRDKREEPEAAIGPSLCYAVLPPSRARPVHATDAGKEHRASGGGITDPPPSFRESKTVRGRCH